MRHLARKSTTKRDFPFSRPFFNFDFLPFFYICERTGTTLFIIPEKPSERTMWKILPSISIWEGGEAFFWRREVALDKKYHISWVIAQCAKIIFFVQKIKLKKIIKNHEFEFLSKYWKQILNFRAKIVKTEFLDKNQGLNTVCGGEAFIS